MVRGSMPRRSRRTRWRRDGRRAWWAGAVVLSSPFVHPARTLHLHDKEDKQEVSPRNQARKRTLLSSW